MRVLLLPLGLLYGAGAALRRWYFNKKGRAIPSVFTVVVGNLSVGGTGKTPLIIQLANALSAAHMQVAILSRGYGRATQGFYQVNNSSHTLDVGEEPLEIFKKTGLPVFVNENRIEAIQRIQQEINPDIILLDDGFQHLPIQAHFNLILDKATKPFFKNWPMPAGSLREFPQVLRYAQALVYTKLPQGTDKALLRNKAKKYVKEIFYAKYITQIPDFDRNKNIILVSAVADNQAVKLACKGLKIVKHYTYSDHYTFTQTDHQEWSRDLKIKKAILLTTAKDKPKISRLQLPDNAEVHTLHTHHQFLYDGLEAIIALILNTKKEYEQQDL